MPTSGDNTTVRFKSTKIMDDGEFQKFQGSGRKGEEFGQGDYGMTRAQNYGFTANPPEGSIGQVSALNGNPDHSIATHMEHPKYRPKNLTEGDVMFYSKHNAGEGEDRKDYMKFEKDTLTITHAKKIVLKVGKSTITITSGNITAKSGKIDLNP